MLIQHSTNLTICIWIKIPPFQRNARERYLKMSELDVTGDTDYSDVSAMAEELSRASVLFEYNIKGLQPQTKSVSLFYCISIILSKLLLVC